MNKLNILFFIVLGIIFTANFASATGGTISGGVQTFGGSVFGGTPAPPQAIASIIIKTALTFLGILFVGLIIYGGFLYMTSQGKDEQIKKAKQLLTTAVIGLLIVITAYALSTFVINAIINATGPGTYGGQGQTTSGG